MRKKKCWKIKMHPDDRGWIAVIAEDKKQAKEFFWDYKEQFFKTSDFKGQDVVMEQVKGVSIQNLPMGIFLNRLES